MGKEGSLFPPEPLYKPFQSDGWSPLLSAANRGHFAVAELLLDRGADTECCHPVRSSLPRSVTPWNRKLFSVRSFGKTSWFVQENRGTPLIYTAVKGYFATAKLLVDVGANLRATDSVRAMLREANQTV